MGGVLAAFLEVDRWQSTRADCKRAFGAVVGMAVM
jgi:hypothetical protein